MSVRRLEESTLYIAKVLGTRLVAVLGQGGKVRVTALQVLLHIQTFNLQSFNLNLQEERGPRLYAENPDIISWNLNLLYSDTKTKKPFPVLSGSALGIRLNKSFGHNVKHKMLYILLDC
jgi:hypothetical protein